MTFGSFTGNRRRVRQLQESIRASRLAHAYLITGPQHIGKLTLAKILAGAVQCTNRTDSGDSCGMCTACHKVQHGNHPDVIIMELPKDKQSYSIEQIRSLIDGITFKPNEGQKRIYIVPNADALTVQAQQASLKILEEPPPTGMIILTAASDELVLPTMLSRCQEIALTPVDGETIAAAVCQRYPDADTSQVNELAILSGGCPGWAFMMLEKPEIVAERRATLEALLGVLKMGRAERIDASATFAPDRERARECIEIWLSWWHDVLVYGHGASGLIQYRQGQADIVQYAQRWGTQTAQNVIRAMIKALAELDRNGNPRLVFDVLLQNIPITR